MYRILPIVCISILCLLTVLLQSAQARDTDANVVTFVPVYPQVMRCGQISSRFGSMRDLDGSLRGAPHDGIDLGAFGDVVIAPADGVIGAIWRADHTWGNDWNILMIHTANDLNLPENSVVYYTEFDHLQRKDMQDLEVGKRLQRGDPVGVVRHPGNNSRFRAEVHMEVYELPANRQSDTEWRNNAGFRYWWNASAKLIDPLEMLSKHMASITDRHVKLTMYEPGTIPGGFRGFVYPISCLKN